MTMHSKLAAFRIEQRRISVAVFVDDHLEFTGSRQLPSVFAKASDSVGRYVAWIESNFNLEAAALDEQIQSKPDTWRSRFTKLVIAQLRTSGIPVFEVDRSVLLTSFGHPPLRYKTELRQVVSSIWPILATKDTHPSHLDAAALGLHVQVERMFGAFVSNDSRTESRSRREVTPSSAFPLAPDF